MVTTVNMVNATGDIDGGTTSEERGISAYIFNELPNYLEMFTNN